MSVSNKGKPKQPRNGTHELNSPNLLTTGQYVNLI